MKRSISLFSFVALIFAMAFVPAEGSHNVVQPQAVQECVQQQVVEYQMVQPVVRQRVVQQHVVQQHVVQQQVVQPVYAVQQPVVAMAFNSYSTPAVGVFSQQVLGVRALNRRPFASIVIGGGGRRGGGLLIRNRGRGAGVAIRAPLIRRR